jgi:hypothetical protein
MYSHLYFLSLSPFLVNMSNSLYMGCKGGFRPPFFCSCPWDLLLFFDRTWYSFLCDITIRGFYWSYLAPPRSRDGLSSHLYRSAGDPKGVNVHTWKQGREKYSSDKCDKNFFVSTQAPLCTSQFCTFSYSGSKWGGGCKPPFLYV